MSTKEPSKLGLVVAALSMIVLLLIIAGGAGYQFEQHQHAQWCQAWDVLTTNPVPKPADPAANPSREDAYNQYHEFTVLKQSYGCG
jgi:hypothetical protein